MRCAFSFNLHTRILRLSAGLCSKKLFSHGLYYRGLSINSNCAANLNATQIFQTNVENAALKKYAEAATRVDQERLILVFIAIQTKTRSLGRH